MIGRRLAVGAEGAENNRGYVKVYDLADNDWIQVGEDITGIFDRSGL